MRLGLLSGISLGTILLFVACGSEDDKKKAPPEYSAGGEGGADAGGSGGSGNATNGDAGTTSVAGEPSDGGRAGAGGTEAVTGGAAGSGEGGAGGEATLPFHGLYIGETGDDMADGTHDAPFETLAHAASVAQPGDTIVFLDGTFAIPAAVTIPAGVSLEAENAGAATLSGSQGALHLSGDTLISNLAFTGFSTAVDFAADALAVGTLTVDSSLFTNCTSTCLKLTGAAQAVVSSGVSEVLGNGGGSFAISSGTSSLSITGGVLKNYQAGGILRASDESSVSLQDLEVQDGTGAVLTLADQSVGHVDGAIISTLSQSLFSQTGTSELVVTSSDLSMKPAATAYNCFSLVTTNKLSIEASKIHACGTGIKGAPGDITVVDTEFYDLSFGGADLDPGGGSTSGTVKIIGCDIHDVAYTGMRIGGGTTLLDLEMRDTSIDVTTLANWGALIVNGTNASTIDLGTLAEPGGNTFLQHTIANTTAVQLNLQAQTVYAVGNTWTPNQQGADENGHYVVKTGKVLEDSTAVTNGRNYIKQYATTTIRLAQIP
jgi:hypothetical protein